MIKDLFTSLNIGLIIGILAVAMTLLGAFPIWKKKQTRKTVLMVGVLGAVVVLILSAIPGLTFFTSPVQNLGTLAIGGGTEEVTDQGVQTQQGVLCAVEDTTVTLAGEDKYNSSVTTGLTHKYRVNGAPALTVSDAGTFTASPGDKLQILWGNSATTVAYFSSITEVTVPCSGTKTFSEQLVANGTVSFSIYNEEGNVIDAANNETLGAGDVPTLKFEIRGTYQKGQPYGGVLVATYNKTAYDDVKINFGGSQVSVPNSEVTNGTQSSKAYEVPAILDNALLTGNILIDVATYNPTDTGDAVIYVTYYPKNPFVNEETGASFDAPSVEDEKDVQTYAYKVTTNLYVK